MSEQDLYQAIVADYEKTQSIKQTAENLNTNTIKVRRVLITEGLWSSKTSIAVGELHEKGYSTSEIAKELFISEKNVQSYLPYTKGAYGGGSKNDDAERAAKYRSRKRAAVQGIKNLNGSPVMDENKVLPAEVKSNDEERLMERGYLPQSSRPIALKLHLELNMDGITTHERRMLEKYGKVKQSISRDVIVPAEMTLRALHYVIQRAFGWQNSHLHYFKFPDDVFDKLTQDSSDQWLRLCGVYFRVPDDDREDIYWDADYDETISFKNWLKSKYTGPYYYAGGGDYYIENQRWASWFKQKYGSLSLKQVRAMHGIPQDINFLLERLAIPDFLNLPNGNSKYFAEPIEDFLAYLEEDNEKYQELWNEMMVNPRENFDVIQGLIYASTIRMKSQADSLIYRYDYGDNWEVTITCENAYYMADDPFYWMSENKLTHLTGEIVLEDAFENSVDIKETKTVQEVCIKQKPVCVASDGLNLFDDAGGVKGFAKFLETLNTTTRKDVLEEILETPKMYGWTAKEGRLESRL